MKRFLSQVFLASTAIYLSACASPDETQKKKSHPQFGYEGQQPVPEDTQTTPQPVTPPVTQTPPPKQDGGTPIPPPPVETTKTQQPGTPPPQAKDYPYGTSVPNKPGFVTSPHAPYAGYVDVRGIPTGTPVKDPYTGKIFLVP